MSYLDEAGLARYDGLLKGLALRDGAGSSLLNWQKTSAAGAVSFLPVPEMPIDPVVNFLFSETGPASGTKGPDNPSTITGVTQAKVTRCGKNLLAFPYYSSSFTSNDVTFTVASDGTVSTSGTASGDVDFYIASSSNGPWLSSGLSYTLSGCPSGGSTSTYYMRHSAYPTAADTGSGATFTASASGKPAQPILIRIKSGTNTNNLVFKPQLELGSTATSFEKYEGTDYIIPLNGTYYGGSVDFSTGLMTVTWGSLTFSSVNNFQGDNGTCVRFAHAYPVQVYTHYSSDYPDFFACEMFPVVSGTPQSEEFCRAGGSGSSGSQSATFSILKSRLDVSGAADPSNPTNAEWLTAINAWLAEHPVTYYFKLYYPYTVSLTPQQIYSLSQSDPYTPRINTVYSDQVSVQVGYPKSPQATQNELTSAIVSLGGNV